MRTVIHRYCRPPTIDKLATSGMLSVRIATASSKMKEDSERTARETDTYADKILSLLDQLEELHCRKNTSLNTINVHSHANKEKFDNLFSTYSSLFNELAPWRTQVIQAGEEASQVQAMQMRKSRKDTMNAAKHRLDEGREKQQLATDATELMKHYKALIMTT